MIAACRIQPRTSRRWLLVAACLACALAVCGPGVAPGQTTAPSASPDARGTSGRVFLWRVESPTAVVHLLGSIHMAGSALYPLDARIEEAFARARTLVLEIPVDPNAQREAAEKMARMGTYPAGDGIDLHLGHEVLEALQAYVAKQGVPCASVRPLRPWFVGMVVTIGAMQQLGYTAEQGIDMHFAGRVGPQRRVEALETVDEQVALFSGLSDPVQEQMLKEALGAASKLGTVMERTAQLWRAGDVEGLDALLLRPLRADFPGLYQDLFVQRNRRMAAAIERYLRGSGEYFVIVGSGHLIGPDGIVTLLAARGFAPVQQ